MCSQAILIIPLPGKGIAHVNSSNDLQGLHILLQFEYDGFACDINLNSIDSDTGFLTILDYDLLLVVCDNVLHYMHVYRIIQWASAMILMLNIHQSIMCLI